MTTIVLGGDRTIRQKRTNWHYLLALPRLWREVRAANADLINAHFLSSYGILGALVLPRHTPYVISLHGSDVLVIPRTSSWLARAARWALRRATLVTSVAEHMTCVVREELGYAGRVHTRQYGVDTKLFRAPDPVREREPLVVSTRRLEAVANPTILLEAARSLGELSLRLRIVGDGSLRSELERQGEELVAAGLLEFAGALPADGVAKQLQEAAIYVTTTLSDGASISLLEAMACGAFPVASDIPANREWIRHGVNGFLFRPESAAALVECVAEAWNNRELRERATAMNLETIRQKGDVNTNLGEIEALFASVADRRGVPN